MHNPYTALTFTAGAAAPRQFPADQGREVAFAGRSNAGKSSALNAVAGRRALARISKTPGRTQQINFFELDPARRFADLPGYGFAKAPQDVKQRWAKLVETYLRQRECLVGLVLLTDSRRPLTDLDRQMVTWCVQTGAALRVVLTKVDKLRRGAAASALAGARRDLAGLGEQVSAQLFSATRGDGVEELRACLDGWLEMGRDLPGVEALPGAPR